MSFFEWIDYDALREPERFPERAGDFPVRGRRAWRSLWERLLALPRAPAADEAPFEWEEKFEEAFQEFLGDAERDPPPPPGKRPCCLFVSHRRCDVDQAERVAYRAAQHGFQYWLDVHDPSLTAANKVGLPSPAQEVLSAAVIEMGLLNSTHVLAVHTVNSEGSKWIPYELGRAKQRRLFASRACGWFDPPGTTPVVGEYTYLAARTDSEKSVDRWLDRQRARAGRSPACLTSGPYWTKPNIPRKCLG